MALMDEMEMQGSWLFRWRSYLPAVLLVLLLPPSLSSLSWPFDSYRFHKVWELVCVSVSLSGLAIRCITVGFVPRGTSGRGTKKLKATLLNTTGMYSLVRHPVYLGNFLIGLGVTMVWFDWWAPMIYSLCFWLYYERIMFAEEQYLARQFRQAFRQWAMETPSFVPWPSQWRHWKKPALRISFVSIVRREYSTLAAIIALHAGMEALENVWIQGRLSFGLEWGIILFLAIAFYILLGFLKKRTEVLNIEGR